MKHDKSYDLELLSQIGEGDNTALQRLFDIYYLRLCRSAVFWLRNDYAAEEVVLDLFTYIWQNASKINITSSLESYLLRSVRNRSFNYLRSNNISDLSFDDFKDILSYEDNCRMDLDDLANLVNFAVSQLPTKCQEVYQMSRDQHLSNAAIAEALNISNKSVEAHITKALHRIKQHIDENTNDEIIN